MSFPLDHFAGNEHSWDNVNRQPRNGVQARDARFEVEGAAVYVGVKQVPMDDGSRPWFGKVESNPARVGDPDGFGLCPLGEVRERFAQVLDVATAELVTPAVRADAYKVKRVDVARDFVGVCDVDGLLLGLAGVHRPNSKRNNLYNDGSRNGAQTLLVGSKAGSGRLYDKHTQTGGGVEAGTLRFEVEARSAWAQRYGGIELLEDVTDSAMEALADERWRWSGMGAEVCTRNEVVHRVMAAQVLTDRERTYFLGWLMQAAAGHEAPVSKATSAKYRRLARDLGVALGPETFAGAVVGRLDWDSGQVVLRAA